MALEIWKESFRTQHTERRIEMLLPRMTGNLWDDWFEDGFFWPEMRRDEDRAEKKLYGGHAKNLMKTDVKEKDGFYELSVDLPGFKKDEVEVELRDGYLTISANKSVDQDKKKAEGKYIRRERYSGSMSRSFYIGENVPEDQIKGSFADGILTLTVPKEETKKVEQRHLVEIEG